ncbi:hypothetical protein [Streptomyces sp. NPDC086023]|uniref:hypothetical protein n=1 Tax=Streptomyces sp. NPDC086023 TaxID=3365746 RepID=UPI0037D5365D
MENVVGYGGMAVRAELSPAQVVELHRTASWNALSDPVLVEAFRIYCERRAFAEHDGTITFEVDGPSAELPFDEYFSAFKMESWSDDHWETLFESDFRTALSRCSPVAMQDLWDCADTGDIEDQNVYEAFRAYCELGVFLKYKAAGRRLSGERLSHGGLELSVEADQMLREQGFEVFNAFKILVEAHRTATERKPQDVFGVTRSWNEEPPESRRKAQDSGWESKRWSRRSNELQPSEGPDSCERLYSSKSVRVLEKCAGRQCRELDVKHPELADSFKAFLFGRRMGAVKRCLPKVAKRYETDDDFCNEVTIAWVRGQFKDIGRGAVFDKIYEEFVQDFADQCQIMQTARDDSRRRATEQHGTRVTHAKLGVDTHGQWASLYDRRLVLLDKHCDLPAEVVGPLADLTSQDAVLFCDVIKSKAAFDLVNGAVAARLHLKKGTERTTALTGLLKDRQRRAATTITREEFSTVLTVLGRDPLLGILTRIGSKGLAEKDRRNVPRALSGKW